MQKRIKKKLKIGIFFSPNKKLGGGYEYTVSVLNALLSSGETVYIFNASQDLPLEYKTRKDVKLIELTDKTNDSTNILKELVSRLLQYLPQVFVRLIYYGGVFRLVEIVQRFLQRKTIRGIDSLNLDLVFFPIPSYISFMIKAPKVISILDLEHRFKGPFKEATAGGRWEYREYINASIAKKAWRIFVDSEKSKNDVKRFYGGTQTTVLKYIPPLGLKLKLSKKAEEQCCKKFKFMDNFVLYPAKFWPHKNHMNLVKAIKILKSRGVPVGAVLTGNKEADFSTFDMVFDYVESNNLQNEVKYFGYTSSEELSYLYKKSLAMVMPTFFGPTNIPVYEAWRMGAPVIYSNIPGCREQLGNAGLLVDPNDPADIADKIAAVYEDAGLRETLVERGRKKIREWNKSDFDGTILGVIVNFKKSNANPKNN